MANLEHTSRSVLLNEGAKEDGVAAEKGALALVKFFKYTQVTDALLDEEHGFYYTKSEISEFKYKASELYDAVVAANKVLNRQ
jgi:hypothetical protein